MDDTVEVIRSNKGGMKIIHKGYMYTVHKTRRGGGIRWRCTQRGFYCKGSISTGNNGPPKVNMPHNHIPDPLSVAVARAKHLDEVLSNIDNDEQEDAMPLQQRLTPIKPKIEYQQPSELKSQPLSPTKLKVTRQSQPLFVPKKQEPIQIPVLQQQSQQQQQQQAEEEVCLRWNSHHSNMQTSFPDLLQKEQYVDVTLASEGKMLKCHRLILSSCSGYFDEILSSIPPNQHPVIFLKDIPFWILKSLCDFMYAGEVHIDQRKLEELLQIAEVLKIKGLARKPGPVQQPTPSPTPPPPQPPTTRLKPKQEKRDSVSPIPQQQTVTKAQQFKQNNQRQNVVMPMKNSPVTRSQLQRPSTAAGAASSTAMPIIETIVDPLKLLRPKLVYERRGALPKPRERMILKKMPMKKMKRRRSPERDSPVPIVQYRRGTRSRPQVKIPKQYHDDYEDIIQQQTSSSSPTPTPSNETTINEDPLIPIEIIKTEPIDVEENDISSFSVDAEELPNVEDPIAAADGDEEEEEGPPTLLPQEIVNPLQESTHGDGFQRIRITTEHLENEKNAMEDSVASIQIAECHSMNLDEQQQEEEESRRMDEGFETMVNEVFGAATATDGDDAAPSLEIEPSATAKTVEEEKMDVEVKDEGGDAMENHVGVDGDESGDCGTEKVMEDDGVE